MINFLFELVYLKKMYVYSILISIINTNVIYYVDNIIYVFIYKYK